MRSRSFLIQGAAALLALAASSSSPAWADPGVAPRGYSFRIVARAGDPVPGTAATVASDLSVGDINVRGDVVFDVQMSSGGTAILFARGERLRKIAATGETAPGGGTYASFPIGRSSTNSWGDVAFDFLLEPIQQPFGVGGGVFRRDGLTGAVEAVALADVTPAPGGAPVRGSTLRASIDDRREVVFGAIISTTDGVSGELGNAVLRARRDGSLATVLAPGDPAPDGSTIDMAMNPSANVAGQVAVAGHQSNQECIDFGTPQEVFINCATSVYLVQPGGDLQAIALQGDAAPGGGTYRFAWSPVLNGLGQVAFVGDLSPPPGFNQASGVFLHHRGRTRAIARPGDAMPGGGRVAVVTNFGAGNLRINNRGEVAFNAVLDTGSEQAPDTGAYLWSRGRLVLVARTGTVIPGAGTVASVQPTFASIGLNDRGQVALSIRFEDGGQALLIATPR